MIGNKVGKFAKNCILIHGAWHTSNVWQYVASPIQKFGYNKVLTPDLPGHGSKINEDYRNITLDSYVNYITKLVNLLPEPTILVGHSMSGVIISQVAENIPNKIAKLVYISGFIPDNQGSLIDEEKKAKFPSVALEVKIDQLNCAISIENPVKIRTLFYNRCNNKDVEHATKIFQKQPLLPFLDKVAISKGSFGKIPKLYIECTQDNAINIEDQRRMHSKIACDVVAIDTDHSPFFSAPEELIKLIGNIATE